MAEILQITVNETTRPEDYFLPDGEGGYTLAYEESIVATGKKVKCKTLKSTQSVHMEPEIVRLYYGDDLAATYQLIPQYFLGSKWRDFNKPLEDYLEVVGGHLIGEGVQGAFSWHVDIPCATADIEWQVNVVAPGQTIRLVWEITFTTIGEQLLFDDELILDYLGFAGNIIDDMGSSIRTITFEPDGIVDGMTIGGVVFSFTRQAEHNEYSLPETPSLKLKPHLGSRGPKFVPNINIPYHFDSAGELRFLNLNFPDVVTTETEVFNAVEDEVRLTIGNNTHRWFNDDGYLEWELEFASNPGMNEFVFDVLGNTDLEWRYQDTIENDYALYPEDYPDLASYIADHNRPLDVEGSYAIYCSGRGHFKDGGHTIHNYRAGKMGHIYRPIARDSAAGWTWCDLSYDDVEKQLTVTIPQSFLDSAIYPVVLDPTFGDTTCGSSNTTTDTRMRVSVSGFSPASDGVSESVSLCLVDQAGSDWNKITEAGYYSRSDGDELQAKASVTGFNSPSTCSVFSDSGNLAAESGKSLNVSSAVTYDIGAAWGTGDGGVCYDSGSGKYENVDYLVADISVSGTTTTEPTYYVTYSTGGESYTASGSITPAGGYTRKLTAKRTISGEI